MKVEQVYLYVALVVALLGIINWILTRYEQAKGAGASESLTSTGLDAVRQGNANILVQLDKMDSKMDNYQERLVRVEESAKSAHNRLNEHVAGRGHI